MKAPKKSAAKAKPARKAGRKPAAKRGAAAKAKAANAKAKAAAKKAKAALAKKMKAAQAKAASPEGRAERKRMEEAQAIENMTGDFIPVGRFAKTVGGAAKSARTALATRAAEETPITFLGASGRRAVNPDLLPGSSRSLVPYKKGGAVKAKPEKAEKPAAKGWGKARGARGAKYY